jgi:hypothetical protein
MPILARSSRELAAAARRAYADLFGRKPASIEPAARP